MGGKGAYGRLSPSSSLQYSQKLECRCERRKSKMGLKDVEGKRTGRPRGSKSRPPWIRAARWAIKNLDNPDAVPPTPLARRLVALGREQPESLVICLATLDASGNKPDQQKQESNAPVERQPNAA